MRSSSFVLAAAIIFLACTLPAYAWGPVGHFAIQRSLGADPNQICMNLPDAWPNSERVIFVTTWFAWTHGVQTNGYNGLVPNSPIYPDDGRYPGYDVYQLATKKRRNAAPQDTNTAYSFIGHNAMDREVHYGYFLGGTSTNWLIHHRDKELWTDYELFMSPLYGNGTFDLSGNGGYATSFFGIAVDHADSSQVYIPCGGDAEIIQLAQKVYRKNRRFTSRDNTGHLSEVDTVETINTRIRGLQQEINDGVRAMRINRLQELRALARDNNWTLEELQGHVQGALTRAAQRIDGAGN
jgi:hypothetical protein